MRRFVLGAALTALALSFAFGGLVWRLSQGPIAVSFLTERIEAAVQQHLPEGFTVRISDTVVERSAGSGEIFLSMRDVGVSAPDGEGIFAAPRAAIGLSTFGLATGRVLPRSVWLIEPTITLVETDTGLRLQRVVDGEPSVQQASTSSSGGAGPIEAAAVLLALLTEDGSLSSLGVRNAIVTVLRQDREPERLEPVSIGMFGARDDGRVEFNAMIGNGPAAARLAGGLLREDDADIFVEARFDDLAMNDVAALLPPNLPALLTSPMSGDLAFRLGRQGELEAASAHFSVAAGHVGFGEMQLLVDEADIRVDWNGANRQLTVLPSTILAGHNSATISAQVAIPARGDFSYGTVPMRMELTDVELGDPRGGRSAVYPSISGEAFYVPAQRIMHVSRLDVAAANAAMSFVGFIGGNSESPSIRLAGSMVPMPFDALKDLWPPFLGPNTRNWVIQNLNAGEISDARLTLDIGPGLLASAMRGVPLPDSAYLLEFGLEDVVFSYLGDLPPISGAGGRATLTPGSFDLRMQEGAKIELVSGEVIDVGRGRFHVGDRRVNPAIGDVSLAITGTAPAILKLVDNAPLNIAKRRGLDPDKISGDALIDIQLAVPLMDGVRLSDVRLKMAGTVEDFEAEDFAGARTVAEGRIDVRVADNRFMISGQALLDGLPAEIALEDSLDGSGEAAARSVTMTLDEAARARLGIPLGGLLSGPITATVSDIEATATGTEQRIEADLTSARISLPALGIDKPSGEKATADLLLAQEGDSIKLSGLRMESSGIRLEGEAEFSKDGGLVRLDLPVVRTARGTDLSVSGRREGGSDVFVLRGKAIDLRSSLKNVTGTGQAQAAISSVADSGQSGRMRIEIDAGSASGFNGQALTGVKGTVMLHNERVERLELTGRTAAGVAAGIRYSDDGTNADLAVQSDDGGALLAWTGVYPNMRSGRLNLTASRRGAAAAMTGRLAISGFGVADDPSLARLIESGERDVRQRGDAGATSSRGMNVSSVGFDSLTVPFVRSAAGVTVRDGVLRGPAVGATIEGSIDFSADRLALHGTYVPLYALNNLFGQLPLFGPLLGGKRNEGLLGITYSISGGVSQPVLTINPLSVVAPGVFRYILGMDNPRAAMPRAGVVTDPSAPR